MQTWYHWIEEQIMRREHYQNYAVSITTFEAKLLKLERQALAHPYSTYMEEQLTRYRGSDGEWHEEMVEVVRQHEDWIQGYILQHLGGVGRMISNKQLSDWLNHLSTIYHAAEFHNTLPPLVVLPHQMALPGFGKMRSA